MRKTIQTVPTGKRDRDSSPGVGSLLPTVQQRSPRMVGGRRAEPEDSEASHEGQGLPFEALSLHLDHTHEVLSVIVRKDDTTQGHTYQSIPRPSRVIIERTGPDVSLHIHSTDGSPTIIRFRRVATPDYDSAAKGKTGEVFKE